MFVEDENGNRDIDYVMDDDAEYDYEKSLHDLGIVDHEGNKLDVDGDGEEHYDVVVIG